MEPSEGVIVTGAGSGLGRGVAEIFAAAGHRVFAWDLSWERAHETARAIGAEWAQVDVCSPDDIAAGLQATSAGGGFRYVVHCAGIGGSAPVYAEHGPAPLDAFEQVLKVNLVGTFNIVRLVAAALAERPADAQGERGAVVLTGSAAGSDAPGGMAAYAASKAGVAALTLCAARDLGGYGVRVNAIAPGFFDTPLTRGGRSAEALAAAASRAPFPKRPGRAQEFGQLALELCRNPMMNGAVVRLDAGIRLNR